MAEYDVPRETGTDLIGDEQKFLTLARKRFALAVDAESDERNLQLEDLKFGDLQQWDDAMKNARENDPEGPRPCLVVDKVNQYVRQVVNDMRQNRPAIKVRPKDGDAKEEIAEIVGGLVRHIQDDSRADLAFDWAGEQAVRIGQGYIRIRTDYEDYETANQRIIIDRVPSRFSVYLDPARRQPEGSDAEWGFLTTDLPRETFEQQWPMHKLRSWGEVNSGADPSALEWYTQDTVRVAEYYAKIWEDVVISGRKRRKCRVVHAKINGDAVLESSEFMASFIPIIEVCGNEVFIDGKRRTSGLIRAAKDPQRMYNYMRSALAEAVALAPKAPFIGAVGQFETNGQRWAAANRRNFAYLEYDPISASGQQVPPPQRQAFAGIPGGIFNDMQVSEHDIRTSLGMYAESVGDEGQAKSGRAILAKQKEGDTGTFHYIDNLSRAVRHCGKIIVELIPHYYDTARTVRIIGEDGTHGYADIDPEQEEPMVDRRMADGSMRQCVNLCIGKYDVTVTSGPSYNTQRMEAADALTQVLQGNPQLLATHGDLIFKCYDWPMADEMAKRFKLMLPPQLKPQEGQDGKPVPPEIMQAMAQVQQAQQALQAHQQELQQLEQSAATGKAQLESEKAGLEVERARLQAERQVLESAKRAAMLELQLQENQAEMTRMKDEAEAHALADKLMAQISDARKGHEDLLAQQPVIENEKIAQLCQQLADVQNIINSLGAATVEIAGVVNAKRKPRTIQMNGKYGSYTGSVDEDGNVRVEPAA